MNSQIFYSYTFFYSSWISDLFVIDGQSFHSFTIMRNLPPEKGQSSIMNLRAWKCVCLYVLPRYGWCFYKINYIAYLCLWAYKHFSIIFMDVLEFIHNWNDRHDYIKPLTKL